jgi:hypothetical protein
MGIEAINSFFIINTSFVNYIYSSLFSQYKHKAKRPEREALHVQTVCYLKEINEEMGGCDRMSEGPFREPELIREGDSG